MGIEPVSGINSLTPLSSLASGQFEVINNPEILCWWWRLFFFVKTFDKSDRAYIKWR